MGAAERTYRLLLRAYPVAFRAAYEREMLLVFRDQRRTAETGAVRFWAELLMDVARSAPALRLDAMRARSGRDTLTGGRTMKTMGMLAVLFGVFQAANGLAEGWAGGVSGGDARSLAAGLMAAVAGVLLLAAGVALLRRATIALSLARWAAVACLLFFVVVRLVVPRLSIAATAVGIAFPIALLLFLHVTRGRRSATMA